MSPIFDNRTEKTAAGQGKPGESLGKPAPQGDNPDNQHTAKGVVPPGLESVEPAPIPAPAVDHEAVLRSAKHAGAAGALGKDDDELEEIGQRVAEARALIEQRNRATDGNRVKEIDAKLESLGFTAPVATTEAQRRGLEPFGRQAPSKTTG